MTRERWFQAAEIHVHNYTYLDVTKCVDLALESPVLGEVVEGAEPASAHSKFRSPFRCCGTGFRVFKIRV
jgi:hypothetical protein